MPGYYTVWTIVFEDNGDECGGEDDYDVGIVYAQDGVLSGAKNELRLFGEITPEGEMKGTYTDAFSGEQIGTFNGRTISEISAAGDWNAEAWDCFGEWGLVQ